MKIKIKYLSDKIEKLQKIEKGDWIDLRSAEDVVMKAGEWCVVRLGVAMKLPEGYEAVIAPRGSTYKNFGIIQTNHLGVVDNSYCGNNDEWMMSTYAIRDTEIHINDRICQFRIQKNQPQFEFDEVDDLGGLDRGRLGTTGTNEFIQ